MFPNGLISSSLVAASIAAPDLSQVASELMFLQFAPKALVPAVVPVVAEEHAGYNRLGATVQYVQVNIFSLEEYLAFLGTPHLAVNAFE